MLDGQAGAGNDRLNSMHLVLYAVKTSWRPRKESCMAMKLVWRLVNTVFLINLSYFNGQKFAFLSKTRTFLSDPKLLNGSVYAVPS